MRVSYVHFIYEGKIQIPTDEVDNYDRVVEHIRDNIPAMPLRIEVIGAKEIDDNLPKVR